MKMQPQNQGNEGLCFFCKKPGHIARDCYSNKKSQLQHRSPQHMIQAAAICPPARPGQAQASQQASQSTTMGAALAQVGATLNQFASQCQEN